MTTVVNDIDVLLQAAGTRIILVSLPTNVGVDTVNIAADAITNTEIATDAVNADSILAGSITATEMTVTTLSAITADLGTVTAGTLSAIDISGSGNIDITGTANFDGVLVGAQGDAAVYANGGQVAEIGVVAASDNVVGVYGWGEVTANGVNGVANGTGHGVFAATNGSGVGLAVGVGGMSMASSVKVTNLNADKVDGYDFGAIAAGASTATQDLTNKPGTASTNSWLKITLSGTNYYLPVWT